MDLVSIILKNTDYNPRDYNLDEDIIKTIEKGDPSYRVLWDNYCNPSYWYLTDPRELYIDVETELYKRVDKLCKKAEKYIPVIKVFSIGAGVVLICVSSAMIIGAVTLYWASEYIGKRTKDSCSLNRQYWANLPKEEVLESIIRIKEKAGDIIFDVLQNSPFK